MKEALRAWNDANELEKCVREDSFVELYPHLNDTKALDEIRGKQTDKHHCSWLRKDSNACESLPDGVEGELNGVKILPRMVCPHNVYHHQHQVFAGRDGVFDTIERVFRLVSMAELKLLNESDMDVLSISELIAARGELDKQSNDRQTRERDKAQMDSQANQRGGYLPSWDEKK